MSSIRRTPKVFHSSYRPPTPQPPANYRNLRPLIWVLLAVVGFVLVGRLPIFTVKTVTVTGTDQAAIIEKLQTIKGRSIFSRSIALAIDQILATDLSVKTVECRRGIPDTVRCQVSMRGSALVWRRGESIFSVDDRGLVYANGGDGVVVDDRGTNLLAIGQTVASADSIDAYKRLHQGLIERGYGVNNLFIGESLYQVGAVISGNGKMEWAPASPVTAMFITSYPLPSQLAAVDEIVRTKREKITQSIDLRAPGYAYVK